MAKTWDDNTLRFTAANDGTTSRFTCKSITVRPSTTAWVAIIKDADGTLTKFEASGAANESYTADVEGTIFEGAVLTTATNLTSVVFNGTKHLTAG